MPPPCAGTFTIRIMAKKGFINPVTRKRIRRFKSMKRAYISLWVLLILYGLSLVAELLCNNVPLYVHFNGNSYFPVFFYYSEDTFTGSGRRTRPDYKVLDKSPAFSENAENFMIFPPFPYGPLEIINPKSIRVENKVTLRLTPVPRIGTVDITRKYTIDHPVYMDYFAGAPDRKMIGEPLDRIIAPPEGLKAAVAARFANHGAPYAEFSAKTRSGDKIRVSLSTFRSRPQPPETIRLTFREPEVGREQIKSVAFGPSGNPKGKLPDIWQRITKTNRTVLKSFVARRFENPVENFLLNVDGRQYTASFIKEDVQFPFPPVKDHPLGIDSAGRDVLARIFYGLRISLTFGLLLVTCSMALGIAAGAVQGYYGGKLDISAQRMIEIWAALPFLYVMILMGSIYGRGFILLLVIYGLFNWVGISYYIRAEFLNLRKRPFVEAAKCMGVPSYKIIFKHILPNALVPVITFFPFSLVGAIGALAALDYLGFGLPPPTPSWGELLFQAQQYRWAWWLILYPSLALFTVMLLGVFVGEGIRNAYDPKQYSRLQ